MDHTAFHALISGERRGVGPTLLRGGLQVASWFYGAAVRTRNLAYNRGWKAISKAQIPVISVGNVTTGGTGKTPFAAWLARWFRNHGVRVCFLSRGYGAEPGQQNDEALVLDRLCPDVPHLQNADRAEGARIAVEELDMQLLILDDGFQHRRLARDLDIVLIDALEPWGYGHLLPRGLLREPLGALRRADVVVITRADQSSAETRQNIRTVLKRIRGDDRCVEVAFTPQRLVNASGQTAELDSLRGQSVRAFCGIGNPAGFRRTIEYLGVDLNDVKTFPDHHRYTREAVASLAAWAESSPVAAVLTTLKDHVKIPVDRLGQTPLWSVDVGATITAGESILVDALDLVRARVVDSEV
jgi:tetraacyldisaccharide 4'-kinase